MAQQKHGFPRAAQKEGILLDKQIFNNIIQPYDQKLKSTRLHSGSLLSQHNTGVWSRPTLTGKVRQFYAILVTCALLPIPWWPSFNQAG